MNDSSTFIPLHIKSCYSVIEGLANIQEIVSRAAELNFPALALTDFNNIGGFVSFYNVCSRYGIRPIMGVELQIIDNSVSVENPEKFRVTLLAKSKTGKKNLYRLLSAAWSRTDCTDINNAACNLTELAAHSEDLILLTGLYGDFAAMFQRKDFLLVEQRIEFYKQHFQNRFFFEITRTKRAYETEFEQLSLDFCRKFEVGFVATNDTVFLDGTKDCSEGSLTDAKLHDLRVAIQKELNGKNDNQICSYSPEQYLKSQAEMNELFSDLKPAPLNSKLIADQCSIDTNTDFLPRMPKLPFFCKSNAEALKKLEKLAKTGLNNRLVQLFSDPEERAEKSAEYKARLEAELKAIEALGVQEYFLIVRKVVSWSLENQIPSGPGRGTAGESLVNYALGITRIDPVSHRLPFERFLNSNRVSLPEIHIDLGSRGFYKTINCLKTLAGEFSDKKDQTPCSAFCAKYKTLDATTALEYTGRLLKLPYSIINTAVAFIPEDCAYTLDCLIRMSGGSDLAYLNIQEFADFYNYAREEHDLQTIKLIKTAARLERLIYGIEAQQNCIALAPSDITDYAPLMSDLHGNLIIQYEGFNADKAGLMKLNLHSLPLLTIIDDSFKLINDSRRDKGLPELRPEAIPLTDKKCFEMLNAGAVSALDDLDSERMIYLVEQLKPECFNDFAALVALDRPAMRLSGLQEHFIRRRLGVEEITFPDAFNEETLQRILKSTYGLIIYQEQIIEIICSLTGCSPDYANNLRRDLCKANRSDILKHKKNFRSSSVNNGMNHEQLNEIFDYIAQMATYGFCKAHALAWGLLHWQALWLKANYPDEFLDAVKSIDTQEAAGVILDYASFFNYDCELCIDFSNLFKSDQ